MPCQIRKQKNFVYLMYGLETKNLPKLWLELKVTDKQQKLGIGGLESLLMPRYGAAVYIKDAYPLPGLCISHASQNS